MKQPLVSQENAETVKMLHMLSISFPSSPKPPVQLKLQLTTYLHASHYVFELKFTIIHKQTNSERKQMRAGSRNMPNGWKRFQPTASAPWELLDWHILTVFMQKPSRFSTALLVCSRPWVMVNKCFNYETKIYYVFERRMTKTNCFKIESEVRTKECIAL